MKKSAKPQPTPIRKDRRTRIPKAAKELVLKPDPGFTRKIRAISAKMIAEDTKRKAEGRRDPEECSTRHHFHTLVIRGTGVQACAL